MLRRFRVAAAAAVWLVLFRFLVGFGVSGLFAVDLPLVQGFVPTSK
jgi:MFS transporter, putative metabolite:H+ symporter